MCFCLFLEMEDSEDYYDYSSEEEESVDFYDGMCNMDPQLRFTITSDCSLSRTVLKYIDALNCHYDNIAFVELSEMSYHYVFDDSFQSVINQTYPNFRNQTLKEIVAYFKEHYNH